MAAMIGSLFTICLSLAFWVFVIRFIVKGVIKKENDKKVQFAKGQHAETMRQLAEQHAIEYYTALSQAEEARRAAEAITANLPSPGLAQTRSEAIDLQAVETAAYAIIMQAHEEGWIEGGDFADRAAAEARRSEREEAPAVAIAKHAAELRRRGGFGRDA